MQFVHFSSQLEHERNSAGTFTINPRSCIELSSHFSPRATKLLYACATRIGEHRLACEPCTHISASLISLRDLLEI